MHAYGLIERFDIPSLAGKDMSVADNYVGGTYLICWNIIYERSYTNHVSCVGHCEVHKVRSPYPC